MALQAMGSQLSKAQGTGRGHSSHRSTDGQCFPRSTCLLSRRRRWAVGTSVATHYIDSMAEDGENRMLQAWKLGWHRVEARGVLPTSHEKGASMHERRRGAARKDRSTDHQNRQINRIDHQINSPDG